MTMVVLQIAMIYGAALAACVLVPGWASYPACLVPLQICRPPET